MSLYYITGGAQKANAAELEEFQGYERGLLLALDRDSGSVEKLLEYKSPPEVCPQPDPGALFKAGEIEAGRLYLCTPTEVLIYALPGLELEHYISLPSFNDLHHVRPTPGGNLLVTVTGLDMVQEISLSGEVLREWDVLGEPLWSRFSRDIDYRRVASTKPHRSHPNYAFYLGGEIWVTRFQQRDAVCLTKSGRRIAIDAGLPHDGIVAGGRVYFTTVNGCVVAADTATREIVRTVTVSQGLKRPGWCRGLCVTGKSTAVVGFSMLRQTRWKDNLSWLKGGINAIKNTINAPASISEIDLDSGETLWSENLDRWGMSTVFSIHRVD
ncbi:hypothetical protein ACFL4X_02550 [Gemmatimonadota bacterium]